MLSPQTGKIASLVIARCGLYGIDEKYVPVPWAHFNPTAGAQMLMLDTSKVDMSAARRAKEGRFAATNDFPEQSQQVGAFWSVHLSK